MSEPEIKSSTPQKVGPPPKSSEDWFTAPRPAEALNAAGVELVDADTEGEAQPTVAHSGSGSGAGVAGLRQIGAGLLVLLVAPVRRFRRHHA
jgi:hypothetical protein